MSPSRMGGNRTLAPDPMPPVLCPGFSRGDYRWGCRPWLLTLDYFPYYTSIPYDEGHFPTSMKRSLTSLVLVKDSLRPALGFSQSVHPVTAGATGRYL